MKNLVKSFFVQYEFGN